MPNGHFKFGLGCVIVVNKQKKTLLSYFPCEKTTNFYHHLLCGCTNFHKIIHCVWGGGTANANVIQYTRKQSIQTNFLGYIPLHSGDKLKNIRINAFNFSVFIRHFIFVLLSTNFGESGLDSNFKGQSSQILGHWCLAWGKARSEIALIPLPIWPLGKVGESKKNLKDIICPNSSNLANIKANTWILRLLELCLSQGWPIYLPPILTQIINKLARFFEYWVKVELFAQVWLRIAPI